MTTPKEKPTVLITGCTPGGIGHALAQEFHQRGLRVFATARSKSTISDLSEQGIETFELEVTSEESIAALRDAIVSATTTANEEDDGATEKQGTLTFLVNNAGRNYTVPALDVDMDEVRLTFETNVFGVMRMTQAFAPLLITSASSNPSDKTRGKYQPTIVQIGSLAALMPYVFGSSYNASKAALHSYSDTLRLELAPLGVRVVTAVTGGVKSNIARTRRVLPPDSFYAPLEERYRERLVHSQANGVPAGQYAAYVVGQVLKGAEREGVGGVWGWQKEVWAGGKAGLVWFLTRFLPKRVLDWAFMRMFGLWELGRVGRGKGKVD